jgi:hypothetical protein
MAHDVFISYSHRDKTAADAACAVLESSGVRCWIAPRDVSPGAQDWPTAIIEAIGGCRVMVLIFSSEANSSPDVQREVHQAFSRSVPVIPLRVQDTIPTDSLAYYLDRVHWLDALTPPLEAHLQRLTEAVKAILQMPLADAPLEPLQRQVLASAVATGDGPAAVADPRGLMDRLLDPTGYLETAMRIAVPAGIVFGICWWGLMTLEGVPVPPIKGVFAGAGFGLLSGFIMGTMMRGTTARVSQKWSPEIAGRVQMTLAKIGYQPAQQLGNSTTFKPSFRALGFLATTITVTAFENHIDVFGPKILVRRVISNLGIDKAQVG